MAATLEGSTALVTGATAGIGRAIALQLAALGAQVVVHGRSAERGAETVQEIENSGGTARFVAADLGDADDVAGWPPRPVRSTSWSTTPVSTSSAPPPTPTTRSSMST